MPSTKTDANSAEDFAHVDENSDTLYTVVSTNSLTPIRAWSRSKRNVWAVPVPPSLQWSSWPSSGSSEHNDPAARQDNNSVESTTCEERWVFAVFP